MQTYRCPVIPDRDIIVAPLETSMRFLRCRNHLRQVSENSVALRFGNSNNFGHKSRVEEKTVPACHGIGTDKGVLCCDGFTTNGST